MTDSLPWQAVNALPGDGVAKLLGLQKARESSKWGCLACESSDALHAYPGGPRSGFHCWSCGQSWSNVDAAAHVLRVTPAEACKGLARAFGMALEKIERKRAKDRMVEAGRIGGKKGSANFSDPSRGDTRDIVGQAVGMSGVTYQRAEVYGELMDALTLTEEGRAYLEGRSIDAGLAGAYGFRSVDRGDWRPLTRALGDFDQEQLEAAGFWKWLPWKDRPPALVIPYWLDGQVVALRFRRLDDGGRKYMSPVGVRMLYAFNLEALDGPDEVPNAVRDLERSDQETRMSLEIHVTEGELDAFSLHQLGQVAVGLPGSMPSRDTLRGLAERLRPADRVVCWMDGDKAGDNGFVRLCRVFQAVNGGRWLRERVARRRIGGGLDVNDLVASGRLAA